MSELAFRTATELLRALRAREVSSRELLDLYLARIEWIDPRIGAVVTLDAERARKRAEQADAALARGESWGPLHGLPITVKDCFETAGLRTTAGCERYTAHIPTQDAAAVARLLGAGAVLLGKTNTAELALDWQTYNDLHGTTRNPWNPERTSGGSSGGSAAAVASGLTGLDMGSDIGGSIRIPSHCCGVFGHKPSWGIVPLRGFIPPAPGTLAEDDINVVGPLARGAEDLGLALDVLAGPLPDRARGWRLELPPPRAAALRDYRVGAWLDDPACPVDDSVRGRLENALAALRAAGVQVDERARPAIDLAQAVRVYRRLLAPVVAQALDDDARQALRDGCDLPDGDDDLSVFLRDSAASHLAWIETHEERERMRAAWADYFRDYDVLLCPVSPVPALPHDHSQPQLLRNFEVNGRRRPYTDHFGWMGPIGASLLPASVAPVGRTPAGLPVGVQIVAPHLEDRSAIDFADRLAGELGGFEPPPGLEGP